MASSIPLKDTELIDCARANAKQGVKVAAQLCGYGSDLDAFTQELKTACDRINVKFDGLSDLIRDQQPVISINGGVELAPDSQGNL